MQSKSNRPVLIIVGLFLSLGAALLPLGTWGKTYSGLGRLLGGETLWWLAVAIILLYVALVERRPFSSLGFQRPSLRDLLVAVAAAVVSVVGIGLIYALLFPALHLELNKSAFEGIVQNPFWYRVLIVTRAAVAEELLVRGYPIPRLEELSRSRSLSAVISLAAFTYAHLSYWGAAQLIIAFWGGLVLTLIFLWRRNLWVNMIVHWLTDAAGFLLV